MAPSTSHQFRAAAVLYRLVAGQPGVPPGALPIDGWGPADTQDLTRLALLENATAVLHARLSALPCSFLPADARTQIGNLALAWTLKLRLLERRLGEAVTLLAAHGIDVTLLKGAALAQTVYRGFVDRPMADVDLLVDASRARQAHALLREHGWARIETAMPDVAWDEHHHLTPLSDLSGSGLRLELHTAPLEPGHPFALGASELRATASLVPLNGAQVRVPEPHLHAVHAAVHFTWSHRFESGGLNAMRDLMALHAAGALDWDTLVSTARASRAEHCCYWALRLARATAGLAVPDAVLADLRPAHGARALRVLERHLTQVMFRDPTACPSVVLRRRLWAAALCIPHRARVTDTVWAAVQSAGRGQAAANTAAQRVASVIRRLPRWSRYAAGLMGSAMQAAE